MEFDELLITTGVDALVRLVRDRKKIELEEAASALNIGQETLEEWARVLEEEGILRMEYHLTHIYLVWVKPTEEQVSSEVESFKEAKKGIEDEVAEVRKKAAEQTVGFDELRMSFREFYAKAYPRIEKLEKEVAKLPSAKALTENVAAKRQASLAALSSQLEEVKGGVGEAREDLRKLGIGKNASESRGWMDKVEGINQELKSMQAELQELKKRSSRAAPSEVALPPVTEMRKKFESLKKDFDELRSKNAKIRQDMLSLRESSETLKDVAESIVGKEDKAGSLHDEMKALNEEAEALMKKAKDISARVKENEDLTDRSESAVNVAKGILTRFPSQEKVVAELDRMQKAEDSLAEKVGALDSLLEAAGGRQVNAKQFADLAKRMDEKAEQMRRDMDSLAGALEDEKATYLTFQKIKERVVPSIEAYQKQLDTLGTEIGKMKAEAETGRGNIEEDAKKLAQALKGSDAQEALKAAQEVTEKKRMLDEISQSLEDMNTLSENLNKRITLLAREAKILEIRTGGEGVAETEAKREEVRQELKLSEQEELEFRKKREELKNLIKKLWE
jgi:DNA repair exonuclease SbcCD ATPase subunit